MLKRLSAETFYIRLLFFRLLLLYGAMAGCRLLFYSYNTGAFVGMGWGEWLACFVYALRFDTASILYVNLLLVAGHLLPLPFRGRRWYQRGQQAIYYLTNGAMLLVELADVVYFPYAFRRMSGGDLGMHQDIWNLLPQFMVEFWWLLLIWAALLAGLRYGWKRSEQWQPSGIPSLVGGLLILLVGGGATVVGLRGGLQVRPLMPQNAVHYVSDARFIPLVSNTTLGLIHSVQQKAIRPRTYFSDARCDTLFSLVQQPLADSLPMRRLNVVVLVLESFGCEYIGYFNPNRQPSYTPFFDSLLHEGLLFDRMYANGTRSTQGIVAVAGGFPALMDDPYMFSAYQSNPLIGLGNLLGNEGYTTGFFHGGAVGTMDFDKFAPLAGLRRYHGRTHYTRDNALPSDQDYDGNWGIWDMPFYDYTLRMLDSYPQPFLATCFSINPHHPFHVPPSFEAAHPDLPPLWRAVHYADHALRRFFEQARQKDWFSQTLFVLTADHIGPVQSEEYHQRTARYRIPLLLYCPADSSLHGLRSEVSQQIDILPTVLGYLHYPKPYRAFGRNKFDPRNRQHWSYTYESGVYQLLDDQHLLLFDGEQTTGFYAYRQDSTLSANLAPQSSPVLQELETRLKAVIQTHNNVLVKNDFRDKNK